MNIYECKFLDIATIFWPKKEYEDDKATLYLYLHYVTQASKDMHVQSYIRSKDMKIMTFNIS